MGLANPKAQKLIFVPTLEPLLNASMLATQSGAFHETFGALFIKGPKSPEM
jgi:hypothetical protein